MEGVRERILERRLRCIHSQSEQLVTVSAFGEPFLSLWLLSKRLRSSGERVCRELGRRRQCFECGPWRFTCWLQVAVQAVNVRICGCRFASVMGIGFARFCMATAGLIFRSGTLWQLFYGHNHHRGNSSSSTTAGSTTRPGLANIVSWGVSFLIGLLLLLVVATA